VLVSNYQAEYGRMSGGNVEIITKSGGQQFHGSGSYFNRNEDYNANNYFNNRLGLPRPLYRFNTVDYTVGGPVYIPKTFTRLRNKLFFFWSQEYWPEKTSQPVAQLTVPTALERRGDFSQSFDLNNRLIVVKDPTTGSPFPGNLVPANRIDPNGQAILNIFPQPNFLNRAISAGRYDYISQSVTTTPQLMNTLKLDYAVTFHVLPASRQGNRSGGAAHYQRELAAARPNLPDFRPGIRRALPKNLFADSDQRVYRRLHPPAGERDNHAERSLEQPARSCRLQSGAAFDER
jgi:hypothetical protein